MAASISNRLVALLTLCATLTLGLSILLDYRLSRQEILGRLKAESRETIRDVLRDLENLLDGVEDSTLFMGRILQQREYSRPGLEQMLRELVEMNSDVFGATIALNPELPGGPFAPYFYGREGQLTRVDLAAGAERYYEEAWFREPAGSGQPVWVEPYFDSLGAQVLMTTFAVPVHRVDALGRRFLYAVVTADIPLDELHDYLQRLRLGEHGRSLLVSGRGTILSARDPARIMRPIEELGNSGASAAAIGELLNNAETGGFSTSQLPCPWTTGTCDFVVGSLAGTGWPVVIAFSRDELLGPLRSYGLKTALIGLATVLAMALAVLLVTRRLTRPLVELAAASDHIAEGRLDTPLPRAGRLDEVGRLVQSFGAMTRDLRSYIADLEDATRSRSRLEGELAAAWQIQMSMLPGGGDTVAREPGFTLAARVRPAKTVGGDLYHYQRVGERLLFAVGDVSDKGVPAALFMARATSLLQLEGQDLQPARVLESLNEALVQGNDSCMFVTLLVASLDLGSGALRFASAGHPPPVLLRGGAAREVEQDGGPVIGLAPDLEFTDCELALQPGDRLAIYTDGVDEAFNAEGEMFSLPRLLDTLESGAQAPAEQALEGVFDAVNHFAGDTPQSDDITLLLLERPRPVLQVAGQFIPGDGLVSEALSWLEQQLLPASPEPGLLHDLAILLEEAVANIHHHGRLEPGRPFEVRLTLSDSAAELRLMDPGVAFDPLRQAQRSQLGRSADSAAIGGLGVHLLSTLSDRQYYRREGGRNILTLIRERQQGQTA